MERCKLNRHDEFWATQHNFYCVTTFSSCMLRTHVHKLCVSRSTNYVLLHL